MTDPTQYRLEDVMTDREYMREHAFDYALGEGDPDPSAYAEWYVETFDDIAKAGSHSLHYFQWRETNEEETR